MRTRQVARLGGWGVSVRPPAATAPIADEFDGEERAWIYEELGKRVKAWLAGVTNDIHEEIEGARDEHARPATTEFLAQSLR